MVKKIKTLLIANRGEIASRIIKTCRNMGIRSIAIYSSTDENMPYVKEADVSYHLNGNELSETYLNAEKIIHAAKLLDADAIHPGYGFLSEKAEFSRKVVDSGLLWIGPCSDTIESMGLKANAKEIAANSSVPVIPGFDLNGLSFEEIKQKTEEIEYPILVKSSAGGGGKGMRIVYDSFQLKDALNAAAVEALASFGDDSLMIEKYFPDARHIEIQILGDNYDNLIHLSERECTIQRRFQKIIEESPSPVLNDFKRKEMSAAALRLCKKLGYKNAGTVEFIYTEDGNFYFLEVNTRIQVEHPVTEMITGVDIVKEQIRIAEGEALQFKQDDIKPKGYAIECRLYAENPTLNFFPETGKVLDWFIPDIQKLRVDTAVEELVELGVYYDPLIAKIIAYSDDRTSAIAKMSYALEKLRCQGVKTNQLFLKKIMDDYLFIEGNYNTHYITTQFSLENKLSIDSFHKIEVCIATTLFSWSKRRDHNNILKNITSAWRNNEFQNQKVSYICEGEAIEIEYKALNQNEFIFKSNGINYQIKLKLLNDKELRIVNNCIEQSFFIVKSGDDSFFVHHPKTMSLNVKELPRYPQKEKEYHYGEYEAPMPGIIMKILVNEGEFVDEGTPLIVIMSMKMENTIIAKKSGKIESIFVSEGNTIESGIELLKII